LMGSIVDGCGSFAVEVTCCPGARDSPWGSTRLWDCLCPAPLYDTRACFEASEKRA
jgi:hypothetical protein